MNPNRSIFMAMALLALAGLLAATYVFVSHSLNQPIFCPFANGCDAVQDSPYAVMFGIPVSFLGMLGFAAYIGLAVAAWRGGAHWALLPVLAGLSLIEVGFTAYMAYLQVNVIRAICSWCMLSAAITVVLAGLVLWTVLTSSWRPQASGGAVAH